MQKRRIKKIGKERTTYTGSIFSIKERDVEFYTGRKTTFEYCVRPSSVSVLAFNDRGDILLIKEQRHRSKYPVWFLPGGRMDKKGDTPKKAALRELREETGFGAKNMRLIHKKSPSNTLLWDVYVFAAKNIYLSPLPQEDGEITEPHFVPFHKAVEMALDGTIENEFISYNIIRFAELIKRGEFRW